MAHEANKKGLDIFVDSAVRALGSPEVPLLLKLSIYPYEGHRKLSRGRRA